MTLTLLPWCWRQATAGFHAVLVALALTPGCSDSTESNDDHADEGESAQANSWVGQTFLLRVPNGSWTEPRGVGRDIGPFVPGFLIRVDDASGQKVDVTVGTVNAEDEQQLCNPTTRIEGKSEEFPGVEIGPVEFPVYLVNQEVVVNAKIHDLAFANLLPDETGESQVGVLTAVMDFREVAAMFTLLPRPDPDLACAAAEDGLMAPCEPCPNDGAEYCLSLKAEELGASEYEGPKMKEIAAADLGPECEDMLADQ